MRPLGLPVDSRLRGQVPKRSVSEPFRIPACNGKNSTTVTMNRTAALPMQYQVMQNCNRSYLWELGLRPKLSAWR